MSDTQQALVAQLPEHIKSDAEPVFAEPWQAQAFAMVVALLENGNFSWPEWAAALGAEIAHAAANGIADDGSGYYELWLRALERLVAEKELSDAEQLRRLKQAWENAYKTTPHGQPVAISIDQTPGNRL